MGFLQQFHLVIRYNKGIYNKVVDTLSKSNFSASIIILQNFVMHESYIDKYTLYNVFKDVYVTLCQGNQVEKLDYHVNDNLL